MNRAVTCSIQVTDREDILLKGMELGRHVWNQARWQAGVNRKDEQGEHVPYPGWAALDKQARPFWAFQELGRSADGIVKQFHDNMQAFFSNVKRDPSHRPPRYRTEPITLTFDRRQFEKIGNWEYRIRVLGGRTGDRHITVRVHVRPGVKMADVKQVRIKPTVKKGRYQAVLIIEKEPAGDIAAQNIAAVDLGVVNLGAVAIDNGVTYLYNGKAVLSNLRLADKRVAKCKPSKWKRGSKTHRQSKTRKRYHIKATHAMHLAINNFTTSVVQECQKNGVRLLVAGNLTGIRDNADYGKRTNQKLHRWPQLEMRFQLKYKCEDADIEYKEISEAYTSQTCCGCGQRRKSSRVSRGLYKCNNCGLVINADVNGAINMLTKVSPETSVFGVEADFPGLPSPDHGHEILAHSPSDPRTGKPPQRFSNLPHFVGKFDLRNWAVLLAQQAVVGDMPTVNM